MKPITYIMLAIIVIIFFSPINFYDTKNEFINYQIRSFYHADLPHLLANGVSLYYLSFIEDIIGTNQFLFAIIFIWIVSSSLLFLTHNIFPSRKVYTVGFSAVIFGLFVVYISLLNRNTTISITGLIISILPQLIVPGISFDGHLTGILAGIIYILIFPPNKKILN